MSHWNRYLCIIVVVLLAGNAGAATTTLPKALHLNDAASPFSCA